MICVVKLLLDVLQQAFVAIKIEKAGHRAGSGNVFEKICNFT
jgi:hypothetical protein